MKFEKKVLIYKGKPVFEKIIMPKFKRIPKLYEKNEACFMFIEQGEFNVRSQESLLAFDKQNALLAKCFNYFFELNDEQFHDSDILQVIGVLFHPEIILDLFDVKSLQKNKTNKNVNRVKVTPLLLNFKENINYLLDNPTLANESLIELKLKEFIQLLILEIDEYDTLRTLFVNLFNPIEYDFMLVIKNNQYSNLTLDDFAYLCNMSLSNFKRKFKRSYQETPKKYLNKVKIEKACKLLLDKNMSIDQIANECGFDHHSSLNRNFKKLMNMTPSKYRNQEL